MAQLTPIDKQNLPTDPAVLKSLLDERMTEKHKQERQRDNDIRAIQDLDDDIQLIQGQAQFVFGIQEDKPKPIKRDPKTGEKEKGSPAQ